MKKILFLLLILLTALPSFAEYEYSGLYYDLNHNDKTCTVTFPPSWAKMYSGDIIIPNKIPYNNSFYVVTAIGSNAFSSCSHLTSIEIPNSVTSIRNNAFYGCSGLTSIQIPNSATSIEDRAFSGCSSLTSIEIPNSVTSIGGFTFYGCSGLTSIEIPNLVTSIGESTFYGCSRLTSIEIPNSVTSIGNNAFYGCSRLTSIEIPNSVTSIGESAFYGCTGLTSFEIPNSVTSIGKTTFYGCSGITSIEIPNSVISIGYGAFFECSNLTSIKIPNSVTEIEQHAFSGCSNLTKAEFGSIESLCSIVFVGGEANPLCYAHNLYINGNEIKDLVIPNSITSVGNYSFYRCSGLTSIMIPNAVTSIRDCAFYDCSGLTSIQIPNSVTEIGQGAFSGCTGLTSVSIPNSVTSIGSSAFAGCSGLTLVEISNSVTSIGHEVFRGCTGLTSIEIPNSVTSIGGGAFYRCTELTSIYIPNSVTEIGDEAFSRCYKLTSIDIPNSVTEIGDEAFSRCYRLVSVIIGNGVQKLGRSCWTCCPDIKKVIYITNDPASADVNNFDPNIYKDATLYVPRATRDKAIKTMPWGWFDNIVDLEDKPDDDLEECNEFEYNGIAYSIIDKDANTVTTKAGNKYVTGNSVSGELVLPEKVYYDGIEYTVTEIGAYGFASSNDLISIAIPNSITSIGIFAFMGTMIEKVEFASIESLCNIDFKIYTEDNTDYISSYPYSPTGNLYIKGELVTNLDIPSTVKKIPNLAFYHCKSITSVSISDSVTSIGKWAFSDCENLTSVHIGSGVTQFNNYIWRNCPNIKTIKYTADEPVKAPSYTFEEAVYNSATLYLSSQAIAKAKNIDPWKNFKNIAALKILHVGDEFIYDGITYTIIDPQAKTVRTKEGQYISSINWIVPGNEVNGECILPGNPYCQDDQSYYTLVEIGKYGFGKCSSLTSIQIPNTVTEIGASSFKDCSALTTVTIPESITEFGVDRSKSSIWVGCPKIHEVYYSAEYPVAGLSDMFDRSVYQSATLRLPSAAIYRAKTIDPWMQFKTVRTYDFSAGIDDVTVDDDPDAVVEVYNLSGVKVYDGPRSEISLPRGLYIVVTDGKSSKTYF